MGEANKNATGLAPLPVFHWESWVRWGRPIGCRQKPLTLVWANVVKSAFVPSPVFYPGLCLSNFSPQPLLRAKFASVSCAKMPQVHPPSVGRDPQAVLGPCASVSWAGSCRSCEGATGRC